MILELKKDMAKEWHKWFAWYPVCFRNKIIWFEFIQRRRYTSAPGTYWASDEWEYKL